MLRKTSLIIVGLIMALLATLPALAFAPAEGQVVEGQSVPGIALGDARSSVEAAYGQPAYCQNLPYYDGRQGLDGICQFDVAEGGQVTVHYRAANGDPAQGGPADVVFNIRWSQAVSGWVTTAGVNTALALADPEAVAAAYPQATVIYNSVFGNIESIEDKTLGILVDYSFDYLSGTLFVNMAISYPMEPPPAPEQTVRVGDIDLTVRKVRGDRQVRGLIRVVDEQGSSAAGATVAAVWDLADGRRLAVVGVTSSTGYAYFELPGAPRGVATLSIDDVVLAGHTFDLAGSLLSASIRVK